MFGPWVVLASGQSLTTEQVSLVKAAKDAQKLAGVAAVSNVGMDMAPWADCLVSHDSAWWSAHPEALDFSGEKVCANSQVRGGASFRPLHYNGCNSGLMAMEYVWKTHRATKLFLLGFDMHGTHYFGPHNKGRLRNTTTRRFTEHIHQFESWRGPEVVNCTPESSLKKFPYLQLRECLIDLPVLQE